MGVSSRRWSDFKESEMLLALMVLLPLFLIVGFFTAGYVGINEYSNSYGLTVSFCGGEWSRVESGSSLSCSFSVVNDNDMPVILGFFTWGWDPPWVSEVFEVIWDYDGSPVSPGLKREIIITVIEPSVISTQDYSFNIDFVVTVL